VKAAKSCLEVAHLRSCLGDLLEGELSLAVEVFVENLGQEFSDKHSDVLSVAISDLNSFAVHSRDIVVVALTELVHFPDQIISLGCQVLKLVVHRDF
jgi:N-dimethylarginine dimethylaminohydrolase